MIEIFQQFDTSAFRFGNEAFANLLLDWLMPIVTGPWPWILLAMILAVYVCRAGSRNALIVVLMALVCVGLSDLAESYLFKPAFGRLRPCYMLESVRLVVPSCGGSLGLPSGHSTNAMALAVFFTLAMRQRWIWLGFLAAIIIGFSRIYVGVHFPGDVLTGFLIGGFIGGAFYLLIKRWLPMIHRPRPKGMISDK